MCSCLGVITIATVYGRIRTDWLNTITTIGGFLTSQIGGLVGCYTGIYLTSYIHVLFYDIFWLHPDLDDLIRSRFDQKGLDPQHWTRVWEEPESPLRKSMLVLAASHTMQRASLCGSILIRFSLILFRSFVSLSAEGAIPFNAEEFTDPTELRALAEMLGPYGIKLLNETLMWHIQSQVTELRKLVLINKEILIALRTNFDKPDVMKELFKRLQNVDSVLQRMTIIGEWFSRVS